MTQVWSDAENDALLDSFLVKGNSWTQIVLLSGRSHNAVRSQLWKLGVRYNRESIRGFHRVLQRDGLPFNSRDRLLLAMAVSPLGCRNQAHSEIWASALLGRSIPDLQMRWMYLLKEAGPTLGLIEDGLGEAHQIYRLLQRESREFWSGK